MILRKLFKYLFKDYQCYLDLKKLEERVGQGQTWTSHEHWREVAAKYGNQDPNPR